MIGWRFLSCSVQCLQLCAIWTIEKCMCGNHSCWHRANMAVDPGWFRCKLSSTVCLSCVGMTILSSISKQSSLTCCLFRMLNQYCAYEVTMGSQSRFLTKFMIGRKYLFFLDAALLIVSRVFFCSFRQYSVHLSHIRTLVNCGDHHLCDQVMAGF